MGSRDFDPAGSPLRVFGAELRHYRMCAGLSQEQLGARLYCSADLVGKVEKGHRAPTPEFTAACDAAFAPGRWQEFTRRVKNGAGPA